MARIPEADIERLKNEVSVERLVETAGIELKKSGKDRLGACPFHEDDKPSLVVSPAKNLWHCFGCQIGGGPIDWVMKFKGVSFRHAVELLKTDPSLVAEITGDAPVKRSLQRVLAAPVEFDADDRTLLNQTIDYYHETLLNSPEALAYLKMRGIDNPEAIAHFKLGYANRTLGLRLPGKKRVAGADIRTRLQKVGIYRESGHEHFNGSLVIPVIDGQGNATEVYGRKIAEKLKAGIALHLYLPVECRISVRGVWNEQALAESKEIILCEALIDALTFWCAGYRNVTAAYGIEGFTADHVEAFKRYGTERVLIAYDRDEPGDRAADKLAPQLIEMGIEVLRVKFPRGMDANAYALKVEPAHHSLGLVLKQAEWIGRPRQRPDLPPLPDAAPPSPALPSSPLPLAADTGSDADDAPDAQQPQDELRVTFDDRHWRVRGWQKNPSPEQMRVKLQVWREDARGQTAGYHLDTLNVYAVRERAAFIRQAAVEVSMPEDIIKGDMGQVLFTLERWQDDYLTQRQAPKERAPILDADEEKAALALLRSPDLVARIVADIERCGVVGETNNLLAGYLAVVSRKLDTPLAILIQSSSAAGKSSLMDAVLAMVPEEEKVQYSAMTGQSLFYLGETDMQHKILAIAEEEGVRQAAYALKLLQSDGELTMAATGKDEKSGNLTTRNYTVKGPVMLMMTTTAIDVDEELMNRCLVLSVNESREQTKAIHARQRLKQTLEGLLMASDKESITTLHKNAQRLLKPVLVVNPYADRLTFLDDKTRTRRDHMKYLTLIRSIALLHQHQREVQMVEHRGQLLAYIEVTRDDIALANAIAHDVLGRTLDELPPQTRRLLTQLQAWVQQQAMEQKALTREVRFTRRDVREALAWGDTQLKVHLSRLVDLEYVAVHRRGPTFDYELVYDGRDDGKHLCGLIDAAELDKTHAYDRERSGVKGDRSGSGRPLVGPRSGGGRSASSRAGTGLPADSSDAAQKTRIQDGDASPVVDAEPAKEEA